MSSDTIISIDQLKHIAKLSRLEIKPENEDNLAHQLSETATYIDVLNELNTENILPTAQTNNLKDVTRFDEVGKSFTQQEALSQASETCDGYFKTEATIKK
jgi:aspartyl-tRNA(Asn)/glutamyl-tRNA(Gln) amidotransferase subunit C